MPIRFELGQRLSRVMALTGTTGNAQAATCEDFISQFWPTSGSLLLKAIEESLTPVESSTETAIQIPHQKLQGVKTPGLPASTAHSGEADVDVCEGIKVMKECPLCK